MSFVRVAILKHGLTVWDKALVPPSEVERRLRAVRSLMEQNGWDALVAYSDQLHCGGVGYLTNFQSYEPRHPALAIVTATAVDLIPKVAARDINYIKLYSWADEVHECEEDLATSLGRVAELRDLKNAKVAFDGVREAPAAVALAMKSVFRPGAVSDAGDFMPLLRRTKSAAERTLMTVAAEKAESVLASLSAFLRPGMSELEAAAFADYAARSEGCMDTDVLALRRPDGSNRNPFPFAPLEPRLFEAGGVFNVYLALQYHGYWTEISESIVIGEPRMAQTDGKRIARAYLQEALDESLSGAPVSDRRFLWIHGIGLDREEAPFTSRSHQADATGDVLGVHVAVERDGEFFVCGRSAAVTEAKRRVLA
ncbi:MAG: M24 family metallopeptidase [Candidatus Lustribacter sp.]